MAYQIVTCPACARHVQANVKPGQPGLRVGLHTRMDGTGVLCIGTGLAAGPDLGGMNQSAEKS